MVRYVFTWNNYPEDKCDEILKRSKYKFTYCIYGREVAPTTGTPHLQGYAERKHEFTKEDLAGSKIHFIRAFEHSDWYHSVNYIRGLGKYKDKEGINPESVIEWGASCGVSKKDFKANPPPVDDSKPTKRDLQLARIKEIYKDIEKNEYSFIEFAKKYPLEAMKSQTFWQTCLKGMSSPAESDQRYDITMFNVPALDLNTEKIHLLIAPGMFGKSLFAGAHFKHPLFIHKEEDWCDFIPGYHDGVVYDDYDWAHTSFAVAKAMFEPFRKQRFNIKYSNVVIPMLGLKKIITYNSNPFLRQEWGLGALRERIIVHEYNTPLFTKPAVVSVSPASPTPNALLKRSYANAFMEVTPVVPLNRTQVIYEEREDFDPEDLQSLIAQLKTHRDMGDGMHESWSQNSKDHEVSGSSSLSSKEELSDSETE